MSVIVNIGMWFERFVIIVTSIVQGIYSERLEYLLYTDDLGDRILPGNLWIVLHLLFPVLEILPGYCRGGNQTYSEKIRG